MPTKKVLTNMKNQGRYDVHDDSKQYDGSYLQLPR